MILRAVTLKSVKSSAQNEVLIPARRAKNKKTVFYRPFSIVKLHKIGVHSPLCYQKLAYKKTFPHRIDRHFQTCYTDLTKRLQEGENEKTVSYITLFCFCVFVVVVVCVFCMV